ncbi:MULTISPECIES: hypothetical protein [unclassified Corynebacterium]|uniref:hypothetical protein n=1 Tax=unclassified Corynebacterium TaxID=2624378 RepID=UPI0029CA120B|nr:MULTISPECIES: hypothetical protein [unclassified Corynebacterium]WPF65929.1 hypothetical protein OLX12_10300 [Corynebacterium sp. 22KM0430]WPF68422.1 hypothetical protein OLW90_10295 [Corynebacterium sp. 21KM1197]
MRTILLHCGTTPLPLGPDSHQLSEVPTRQELKLIDAAATRALPHDPTPSLDEIAAQPDVAHLGQPQPAPQAGVLAEPLRVVVIGSDAALSAVLTRAMRADYLWVEFGYVPTGDSPAATNWGLPLDDAPAEALVLAAEAPVRPAPLIRTDSGLAVAGSATITHWENTEYTGEIIVDDHRLLLHGEEKRPLFGHYGARLVPMTTAPGIAAVELRTAVAGGGAEGTRRGSGLGALVGRRVGPRGIERLWNSPGTCWLVRGAEQPVGVVDPESLATGRAVQSGGENIRVTVDGVSAKRPVKRVTFYRHLRDLQIARP